jgi:hypothetical protein
MSRIDDVARELSALNLQIKHDMEQAEAKVERVSHLVRELGTTGLVGREVLLGGHFDRSFDPDDGPHDSGQVVQAALLIPEGLGVCLWDPEEFSALQTAYEGLVPNARLRFQSFDRCSPEEKKFLLPFIEEMLEDLTDLARVAASKLEPGPGVSADEYFRQRMEDDDRKAVE